MSEKKQNKNMEVQKENITEEKAELATEEAAEEVAESAISEPVAEGSADTSTEEVTEGSEPKADKKFAILGIIMSVFAVIGVVAAVYFAVIGIGRLVSRQALKEEIQSEIYPLVVTDVPAFEDVEALDSKTVVASGIWHFLMNEQDMDKYDRDAYGTLTVPAVDIEVHIKQLFGENVPITHQMIPDTDFYIPYDEELGCYYIPESPQIMPYAPKVLSVQKQGDNYTAEVGYILPGPFWNVDEHIDEEPNKVMIYTLEEVEKDEYIVLSVASANESAMPDSGEEVGNVSSEETSDESSEETSSEETSKEESSKETSSKEEE